jgi:hypothetical protein
MGKNNEKHRCRDNEGYDKAYSLKELLKAAKTYEPRTLVP